MNETAHTAPPLADALRVAADAYRALLTGTALDRGLEQALTKTRNAHRLRGAAMDLAYSATRQRALSEAIIKALAERPPAEPVQALLAVALAQLQAERHAPYAVVDQTVSAAKAQRDTAAAAGFINGLLRNVLRQREQLLPRLLADPCVRFNLPAWWLQRLQQAYPQQWQTIAQAQLQQPPLVLRVNLSRLSVGDYLRRLADADLSASRVGKQAVWLHTPLPVEAIPGFAQGEVSVQDAGAQLAAHFATQGLDMRAGPRVLDACAAPGGKTGHLAELGEGATNAIDAVEVDPQRAARIDTNLIRLGVQDRVRVHVEDIEQFAARCVPGSYDRILLDAPCTASGVIRRHPDIPWLRQAVDVAKLATRQTRMFNTLWPLLAPAGRLVFVVCSLFPEEAVNQASRFVHEHSDARRVISDVQLLPTLLPAGTQAGAQFSAESDLPAVSDGFFYAIVEKNSQP